jgi:two-component system NtrC family sensor kinase
MAATLDDEVAELRRANAELQQRLDEGLAREATTAEILRVISGSPIDVQPTFDAIASAAVTLTNSALSGVVTYDGSLMHLAAIHGFSPKEHENIRDLFPIPADHGTATGRAILTGQVVQIEDMSADSEYGYPRLAGSSGQTVLAVPMLRDGNPIGAINVQRRKVEPFTDQQIDLFKTFADQAVIAIENVRLFNETEEALEQQTATAEVLQVINSSPGDLSPVFDAIVEKARSLCEAAFGTLMMRDGEQFYAAAAHGVATPFEKILRNGIEIRPKSPAGRLVSGERFVHIPDLATVAPLLADDPLPQAAVELGGVRTLLMVPLVKDDTVLGAIAAYHQEVRPFTDKQIALLENFAAQAVIAMENARLLTETREALEQQTATTEVLQVINSSPGDLPPVFDAMLEKAMRLCGIDHGTLQTYDGELFRAVAVRGLPEPLAERLRQGFRPGPHHPMWPVLDGAPFVHIPDLTKVEHASEVRIGVKYGSRTILVIPLRKDDALLGQIVAVRQEVRPFTDKQIALLQNFAAQAVIAMENARLLTETREALEQQTATAEILRVINSSPGEVTPVFDAMLEKATRLCEVDYGSLATFNGEAFHTVANRGLSAETADFLSQPVRPAPGNAAFRLVQGEHLVHITDLREDEDTRQGNALRRAIIERGNFRTLLLVSLRKDDALLGYIAAFRQEVRPFSEKQIALLQNFAAQAVIAMENARLLEEIRQRQQELRVTFDNMVDGVAMFDAELRLAAWNRNFQELLGLPADFLAERHGFDEFVRYLTERGEFGETDPETEIHRLRERLHEHYQFERTRPDGTVIEVRHNPMPDGGVVMIYSDITERKRSEAEIHAARDAAEAAYRDLKAAQASLIQAEKMASLGQLTAGIAHEIKNPLNFVNNFADLSVELLDELKETAAPAINALGDEKRAEIDETITMLTGNLEKIAEHGRRADGIVKSMLEHSRGTSGERRSVDLNGLIEEALNLAYHGARAQDASFNITLERDFAEVIVPIVLVPQDITRVCLNLIGNGFYAATKRQKEGSDPSFKPTLKVSTRDLGDAVEIRVRDNGTGIAPEIKDKLFQPFFTTKPTGEGTGLGLSISYDVVTQQHGGTITVDSRVGEFTEFTVRLPRTYQTAMAEAAS